MPIGYTYPAPNLPLDGTEVVDLFQGGKMRAAPASALSALAKLGIGSADTGSGQFYQDKGAAVARFGDRLFVGAAADNPAKASQAATPRDWLSDALGNTSVGAWPVWGAQGASMARFGSIGWLGASRTSDAHASATLLGYTPASIGVASFAIADDTTNPTTTTATAFYAHSIRMANVNYQPTFGAEFEVENRGVLAVGISNPYQANVGGGTYGLQIGSGGGQTSGTVDAAAVLTIVSNPNAFQKGIVFGATALTGTTGAAGDTGFGAALSMARNQGLEWWTPDGMPASILRSTVSQGSLGSHLEFQDSGLVYTNAAGHTLFSVSNGGAGATAYNTLDVTAGALLTAAAALRATPATGGNPDIALVPATGGRIELTSPTSGAGTATPASPSVGYLDITVNGTDCRIPLYAPGQVGG